MMLNIIRVFKTFGSNEVLSDINFSLEKGMKAGLAGANGAGKSTLLKILTGLETRDAGDVFINSTASTGYLPQLLPDFPGMSIDELLKNIFGNLRQIQSRLREIELAMSSVNGRVPADLVDEYSELSERFRGCGGYEIDYRIEYVMSGLGIGNLDRSRNIDSLSGGEKTRINLATLLLKEPDLLLLDEPTNNLDTVSLIWLEKYLSNLKGTLIAASHDREFLNNIASIIFEIDEHTHQLRKYSGNYDVYKLAREAEKAKWEEDYRKQQETIKELNSKIKQACSSAHQMGHKSKSKSKDGDKFVPYVKGQRLQGSVARSIREAEERLRRIRENPVLKPPNPLHFKAGFKAHCIRSAEVIRATGISREYAGRRILEDISLSIGPDSRMVITGPNGCGKTTLMRILAGEDTADSGKVTYAPETRIGYLAQEPKVINPEATVLEHLRWGLEVYEDEFVFVLVSCGLFRYEELKIRAGQLSLGQIRKLQIARLIVTGPNVLLLDEPTNHLSLDTVEAFETAIAEFQGPVLAVSHDRRFIRQFEGEVLEMEEGRLVTAMDSYRRS